VGLLPEPLVIKRGGHEDQLSRQWGLDRFRIRALQKILAEPDLPVSHRQAARTTLARKCAIYAQGCEKRGKVAEARDYRRLGLDIANSPGVKGCLSGFNLPAAADIVDAGFTVKNKIPLNPSLIKGDF